MSADNPISTRIPEDTKERFESYREDENLNKSSAGARLIERGLDWETGELPADDTDEKPVADVLRDTSIAALLFTVLAALWTTPEWGVIALGAVGVVLLAASVAFRLAPEWSSRQASRLAFWRAGQ